MDEPGERLIIVMVADIPADGIDAFQQYEGVVLPLLAQRVHEVHDVSEF